MDALNAAFSDRQRLYAESEALEKELKRTKWNLDVTVKRRMDDVGGYRGKDYEAEKASQAAYAMQAGSGYARDLAKQQPSRRRRFTGRGEIDSRQDRVSGSVAAAFCRPALSASADRRRLLSHRFRGR